MSARKWTKALVKEGILARHKSGKDMSEKVSSEDDSSLVEAAKKLYRGWYAALEDVGIPSARFRRQKSWDRDRIISTLKQYHRQGKNIRPRALHMRDHGLLAAGARIFGSSREMYAAAGIEPAEIGLPHAWDEKKVRSEILKRYESGSDMSYTALSKDNPPLLAACQTYLGAYYKALEACGIQTERIRNLRPRGHWTKDETKKAILARSRKGDDMSHQAVRRDDQALLSAAQRRYGGWYEAVKESGIDSSKFRAQRPKRYWERNTIIKTLQELDRSGLDITPGYLREKHGGLLASARRSFKNLHEMYVAAGIPPEKYMRDWRTIWTADKVKEEIFKRHKERKKLDRQSVTKEHYALVRHSDKLFGGFYQAIRATGLDPDVHRLETAKGAWTKKRVLKEVSEIEARDEDLTEATIRSNPDYRFLYAASYRVFGSWYAALKEAGLDPDKYRKQAISGYWTKDRIKEMIREMYSKGEDISARQLSLNHSDVFSAASKAFGNYGVAVKEAGIDYDSIRRQHKEYTKEELLEFLTALKDQGFGLDVSSVREHNASIVTAAQKRFGSYRKAIEALGLDYNSIRRDIQKRSFMGFVFEEYLHEALRALGWRVQYQKNLRIGDEKLRPDFIDLGTGTWIDAKLRAYSDGTSRTIRKYQKHKKKIDIIYLEDGERIWPDGSVNFIPVSTFYEALREVGAEGLIRDFEKLKKGIVRPELQSELERFSQGSYTKHK